MKFKRCEISTNNFVCGELLPITDFQHRDRTHKTKKKLGQPWIQIDNRCKKCERLLQKHREKIKMTTGNLRSKQCKDAEKLKHLPIEHPGPSGVDRLYFCKLPKTDGYSFWPSCDI